MGTAGQTRTLVRKALFGVSHDRWSAAAGSGLAELDDQSAFRRRGRGAAYGAAAGAADRQKWEEALAWTVEPRIVGNSRLTGAVAAGTTTLPADGVRNWNAGDVVRVQHDGGEFWTTAAAVGSSDVDDVVRFAIAPSVIYLSSDPGLSAGEPLTVGDTDVDTRRRLGAELRRPTERNKTDSRGWPRGTGRRRRYPG